MLRIHVDNVLSLTPINPRLVLSIYDTVFSVYIQLFMLSDDYDKALLCSKRAEYTSNVDNEKYQHS